MESLILFDVILYAAASIGLVWCGWQVAGVILSWWDSDGGKYGMLMNRLTLQGDRLARAEDKISLLCEEVGKLKQVEYWDKDMSAGKPPMKKRGRPRKNRVQ